MRTVPACLVVAALLAPVATGQDANRLLERFELFNSCRPMLLLVEQLDDEARSVGLSKNALQAAAESRLRAARLFTNDVEEARFANLYVNVNVSGRAFALSVRYRKVVEDEFGESSVAATWDQGGIGTHGGNVGYIMSGLSQYLDRFLAAYLRVNEDACNSA